MTRSKSVIIIKINDFKNGSDITENNNIKI